MVAYFSFSQNYNGSESFTSCNGVLSKRVPEELYSSRNIKFCVCGLLRLMTRQKIVMALEVSQAETANLFVRENTISTADEPKTTGYNSSFV